MSLLYLFICLLILLMLKACLTQAFSQFLEMNANIITSIMLFPVAIISVMPEYLFLECSLQVANGLAFKVYYTTSVLRALLLLRP